MKNLKPSQLPEGTVIDDETRGEFIKRADGIWEEMDRDYMGDRDRVTDIGYEDSGMDYRDWYTKYPMCDQRKSDDYFTDFEVIATPPDFVFVGVMLHGPLLDGIGGYADGTRPHACDGYNCEKS